MLEKLILTQNQDGEFYAFEDDLYITSALKDGKRWEPHVLNFLEKCTSSDSIILDAGAHIGTHTVFLGKQATNGLVYAFEPMPSIFQVLEMNVKLNHLTNVKCFNAALSNEHGTVQLPQNLEYVVSNSEYVARNQDGKSNLGGVRIDIETTSVIEKKNIEVITIDSLNLERLDVLKLDVETYEKRVVLGGKQTIFKLRPTIVFEAHSKEMLEDVSEILKVLGYNDIAFVDPYYKMDFYAKAPM